jgi:hypothetical protein
MLACIAYIPCDIHSNRRPSTTHCIPVQHNVNMASQPSRRSYTFTFECKKPLNKPCAYFFEGEHCLRHRQYYEQLARHTWPAYTPVHHKPPMPPLALPKPAVTEPRISTLEEAAAALVMAPSALGSILHNSDAPTRPQPTPVDPTLYHRLFSHCFRKAAVTPYIKPTARRADTPAVAVCASKQLTFTLSSVPFNLY